jgi:hypothetical protein
VLRVAHGLKHFSLTADFIWPPALSHLSVNVRPPAALAKASAHFLYSDTFIGATPCNIIAQNALAGAVIGRVSDALRGVPEVCSKTGVFRFIGKILHSNL